MVDIDTFLTTLYVMVDDFCKSELRPDIRPGPQAPLSRSEVVTLAIMSQFSMFRSQRDFHRYAQRHLGPAFRGSPHRSQFNRQVRRHRHVIVASCLYLVEVMQARDVEYELLDTTGVPVSNVKRRGRGWLAGMANIGKCTRMGWYHGFRLLAAAMPEGMITGVGFGQGSAKEQPLTETMLALRCHAQPAMPSVGQPAIGWNFADMGFSGRRTHERWRLLYGAEVITEPQVNSLVPWPKAWRDWLHSIRQIIETVYDKLVNFFRLDR